MSLDAWRSRFPEVAETDRVHLNNCSVGPIPQAALDASDRYLEVWLEEMNPWDEWLDEVDRAVENFARLINADIDEVAVMTSATQAMAGVASALDYEGRDEVVTSDLDFPTVPQLWHAQGRHGANLRYAESGEEHHVPLEAYEAELSDRTLLVNTAMAYPFTGGLVDVEGLADAVHDHGGYLFLDAYQATGVVPIDVKAQGIDMLTAGSLKFMLGGPGLAFLYVDRELANELEPTVRGWFGVEDRFDFPMRDPEYAAGTRRFEHGTPPVPAAYTANPGMEILLEYGVENVRERVIELTGRLIEGVADHGFEVATPADPDRRGGVVNVQVRHPERTLETLHHRGFKLSERNGGVRAGVHFYNTAAEIDRYVDALADVATPR
ncbi:MAG: aminotransferase class V-fold PLP-dependent enzyme [Halobacteriales archaeon]|nr:aminotransferase class V-fold PLP-dependent enzyme [Halobacteriales archaeon]